MDQNFVTQTFIGMIENIKSDKRQARIKKKFGEIKSKDEIEKPKFMIKVSSLQLGVTRYNVFQLVGDDDDKVLLVTSFGFW